MSLRRMIKFGPLDPISLNDEESKLASSPAATAKLGQKKVAEVAQEVDQARARIEADSRLTHQGKAEAIGRAAGSAVEQLAKVKKMCGLAFPIKQAEHELQLASQQQPDMSTLEAARQVAWEIKSLELLQGMPQFKRLSIVRDAIENGEAAVVNAVLRAPRFLQVIPEPEREEICTLWELKQSPEIATRLKRLRELDRALGVNLDDARTEIERIAEQATAGQRDSDASKEAFRRRIQPRQEPESDEGPAPAVAV